MDEWTDGQNITNMMYRFGQTDRQTDKQMDEWTDGQNITNMDKLMIQHKE